MGMKSGAIFALGFSITLLSGCFVCSETEFPKARPVALDKGRDVTVQLSGFDAVVTTYVPVYEYGTVFAGRPMACRRRPVCYTATYANQTYVPQSSTTTAFAERAAETFEKCGYILQSAAPKYRVEVKFGGPFISDGDSAVSAAWSIFTVFTAGYGTQTWSAKLKIYDIASGRLAYHKDYSQKYEAVVWGPLPLFSPAGSSTISYGSMQSWCLSALTDIAVADAMAFLGSSNN
jgi:hypothetical protein